jgi:hypothetical protein
LKLKHSLNSGSMLTFQRCAFLLLPGMLSYLKNEQDHSASEEFGRRLQLLDAAVEEILQDTQGVIRAFTVADE